MISEACPLVAFSHVSSSRGDGGLQYSRAFRSLHRCGIDCGRPNCYTASQYPISSLDGIQSPSFLVNESSNVILDMSVNPRYPCCKNGANQFRSNNGGSTFALPDTTTRRSSSTTWYAHSPTKLTFNPSPQVLAPLPERDFVSADDEDLPKGRL